MQGHHRLARHRQHHQEGQCRRCQQPTTQQNGQWHKASNLCLHRRPSVCCPRWLDAQQVLWDRHCRCTMVSGLRMNEWWAFSDWLVGMVDRMLFNGLWHLIGCHCWWHEIWVTDCVWLNTVHNGLDCLIIVYLKLQTFFEMKSWMLFESLKTTNMAQWLENARKI